MASTVVTVKILVSLQMFLFYTALQKKYYKDILKSSSVSHQEHRECATVFPEVVERKALIDKFLYKIQKQQRIITP